MEEIDKILRDAGVTPTPVRKLVYHSLFTALAPLSLSDLEVELESIDKSTISRTLNTFKENHLIHSFYDGSGSVKYEICRTNDHSILSDSHVHFRCSVCGKTTCLRSLTIPEIALPDGYLAEEINFIVSGICNHCNCKSR